MHSPRSFSSGKLPSRIEQNEAADAEEDEEGDFWEGDGNDVPDLYETILVEVVGDGRVGLITINRPTVLNALSTQVMDELADALQEFDTEPKVKVRLTFG